MPGKSAGSNRLVRYLHTIEDIILVGLLIIMIVMAVLQITLRNLFDSGILWGDGLVKVLVLWIGLLGAMIASRKKHHISIDVISRYLPGKAKHFSDILTNVFTCAVSAAMTYFSFGFVLMEKEDNLTAFASVPVWVCESIIPFSFGIISIRYLLFSFQAVFQLRKGQKSQ